MYPVGGQPGPPGPPGGGVPPPPGPVGGPPSGAGVTQGSGAPGGPLNTMAALGTGLGPMIGAAGLGGPDPLAPGGAVGGGPPGAPGGPVPGNGGLGLGAPGGPPGGALTPITGLAAPGSPEAPLFVCPRRPNIGRDGRPITLRANHFQISMPRGYIHHYAVNIQPDKVRILALLTMYYYVEVLSNYMKLKGFQLRTNYS